MPEPPSVQSRPPVFIHIGFTNTGTTSLQRNFFAKREDLFFVGEPYGDRGGLFSYIRYIEDFKFDISLVEALCREQIHNPIVHGGRPVVISDETLCDTPQLFFAPFMLPRDSIALRLKHLFPNAKIIVTIRDQRQYVASMYLNLKRNFALFDRIPMPPFSQWFRGMLSQMRCHYLQNLDFIEVIDLYSRIFGTENILVLPLEMLIRDGARMYLERLCSFIGIGLSETDLQNFSVMQNRRMSVRRNRVFELIRDDQFSQLLSELSTHFGNETIEAFLDDGDRVQIALSRDEENEILRRGGRGNRIIADRYGVDLERYGYLMAPVDEVIDCAAPPMVDDHASIRQSDTEHRLLNEIASLQNRICGRRDRRELMIAIKESRMLRPFRRLRRRLRRQPT